MEALGNPVSYNVLLRTDFQRNRQSRIDDAAVGLKDLRSLSLK